MVLDPRAIEGTIRSGSPLPLSSPMEPATSAIPHRSIWLAISTKGRLMDLRVASSTETRSPPTPSRFLGS